MKPFQTGITRLTENIYFKYFCGKVRTLYGIMRSDAWTLNNICNFIVYIDWIRNPVTNMPIFHRNFEHPTILVLFFFYIDFTAEHFSWVKCCSISVSITMKIHRLCIWNFSPTKNANELIHSYFIPIMGDRTRYKYTS